MRVVVVGATGNIGSTLVRRLVQEDGVREIVGVARRVPATLALPKVRWQAADVTRSDLVPILDGADAVVHLAWKIQPSHDLRTLEETNVHGSRRVLDAARVAGVPCVVGGSSVGAYSPGPKDRAVDESWPTAGVATSFYARHKAALERALHELEQAVGDGARIVRVRPGLVFQRSAGTEIRRLFAGPLLPVRLLAPLVTRVLPDVPGLRFQAVHADDVARAYVAVVLTGTFRGALNVAADPVLDVPTIAEAHAGRAARQRSPCVSWAQRLRAHRTVRGKPGSAARMTRSRGVAQPG